MTFCNNFRGDEKQYNNKQENQNSDNVVVRSNWRRINGLQFPWHAQQIAGWISLIIFLTLSFLIVIPALGPSIQPIFIFLLGSLSFLHIVSHITAIFIDPADPELRRINRTSATAPEFDRSKHAHVIENGRCHLCNIRASGPRTKHCRVCNKCVERFDHHCKWLNHCVGARNYVSFLVCVVSAVFASLVIFCLCLSELFLYSVDPAWLDSLFKSNIFNVTFINSNYVSSSLPLPKPIFLSILVAQSILSVVAASLLLHLCFFHIYISVLGVTTYEYIRNYRQLSISTTNPPIGSSVTAISSRSSNTSTSSLTPNGNYLNRDNPHICSNQHQVLPQHSSKNSFCFCSNACENKDSPPLQTQLNNSGDKTSSSSGSSNSSSAQSIVKRSPIENYCTIETIEAVYKKQQQFTSQSSLKSTQNGQLRSCQGCEYCKGRRRYKSSTSLTQRDGINPAISNSSSYRLSCCTCCQKTEPSKAPTPRYYTGHNRVKPSTESTSTEIPGVHKFNTTQVYVTPRRASSLNSLPALPPPPRRQIQSVSLKELNEILSYAQRPQSTLLRRPGNPARGQLRRKSNPQLKPTKTANLSPIHESGLSNPSTPHLKEKTMRPKQGNWVSPLTQ